MYNPNSKPSSPQSTTYVPVVETETCKVFYTSEIPQSPGGMNSFSRSSTASPSPLPPLDTSLLGEDILNTSSVSSKTRTVETITVSFPWCFYQLWLLFYILLYMIIQKVIFIGQLKNAKYNAL